MCADGGQAGIDMFRAACDRKQPFSAVITDLGMPHVDGRQVAAAIKGIEPNRKSHHADRVGTVAGGWQ